MGVYTVKVLEKRGIEVYWTPGVKTLENGHVMLDDGTEFDAVHGDLDRGGQGQRSCADGSAAGRARPGPVHRGAAGRGPERTCGRPVTAAGVPDLSGSRRTRRPCAARPRNTPCGRRSGWCPTCWPRCVAVSRKPYFHKYAGSVASLGLYKGVSDVLG